MSDAPAPAISLSERLAGKWQIPAFVLALGLLAGVAVRIKSPDRKIPIAEHLEALAEYDRLGMYAAGCSHAERLLGWPDLSDADRGALTLALARAKFGRWVAGGEEQGGGEVVIAAYDDVQKLGVALAAQDERHLAEAFHQQRRYELAVKHYNLAAALAPDDALADLRQVIELSIYPLRRPQAETDALLDGFIARAADDPEALLWGLTRRLESLADAGDTQRAAALLEQYADRFDGDALQNEYTFLLALNLRGAGRYDEAERLLRELLNRVALSDPVYPKAGWLLGSVVMFDGRAQRPEEAIAIFRDVIASRADRVYVEASRVSMAEALAAMQRYQEALAAYREVVGEMSRVPFNRLVNPDSVRTSLTV
ncbi:MAG: hypothetical protein H6816_08240, partial [Phycisphaerales bacterium]|nr:hypothetical protein [Phycisphaerales bacterium]